MNILFIDSIYLNILLLLKLKVAKLIKGGGVLIFSEALENFSNNDKRGARLLGTKEYLSHKRP